MRPKIFFAVRLGLIGAGAGAAVWTVVALLSHRGGVPELDREALAAQITQAVEARQYPTDIELQSVPAQIRYTIDWDLQEHTERLFRQYRPDYGAFVAMNPRTGAILAFSDYVKHSSRDSGHLALRATFPAASVFKVVTATAVVDRGLASSDTVIPFNGMSHTLYRRNVMNHRENRWTNRMTLREAFGKSVNTVFGKLGVFHTGPDVLRDYAMRFGFNRAIPGDLAVPPSTAYIPNDDSWGVVEAASGFTRENRMSPLQGALIASAVANDGVMMAPYLVDEVRRADGEPWYESDPEVVSLAMDSATAAELKSMMRETVRRGTTSGTFRSFLRDRRYQDVEIGGKTGSLTGSDPRGRCDWFVGYAELDGELVAFAALTVHEKFWTVKSAQLVRQIVERRFRPGRDRTNVAVR